MSLQSAPRCTYIRITGHACKSPALKGKNFCYLHERVIRGVAMPIDSRIDPMFILENRESIQYAIMEIMDAVASGAMEHKTASLLLRALNIAERNSRRSTSTNARGKSSMKSPTTDANFSTNIPNTILQPHPAPHPKPLPPTRLRRRNRSRLSPRTRHRSA
jgi:hypothetical protein